MKIDPNGERLLEARQVPSPNCDARPAGSEVSLIIIHGISLPPGCYGGPEIDRLFTNRLDPGAHPYFAAIAGLKVSSHLLIRRDGELVQYVPFTLRAWHAGESCYDGCSACNDFSIGIELEGQDQDAYTNVQYERLAAVLQVLIETFPRLSAATCSAAVAAGCLNMKSTANVETEIELLRHGEPVGGRRYRGKLDDVLSEKGWQQMWRAVGERADWDQIVTSPLQRCHAFAMALGERHGLPVCVDARFTEVGFGSWEGRTRTELEALAPGQVARFLQDPVGNRPPGAEGLVDFISRVHTGLVDVLHTYAGKRVLRFDQITRALVYNLDHGRFEG